MRALLRLAFVLALSPFVVDVSSAQAQVKGAQPYSHNAEREKANENILMLLAGQSGGPYIQLAQDIAVAVNDANVRVLPIASNGAVKNVYDVLYLRGVDLGISSIQVLNSLKASGEYGPNLDRRLAYIAPLSVDMFHVLARAEFNSLKDLHGKRVSFFVKGSATATFGPQILKALGVNAEEVHANPHDAVQLLRDGKLDAAVCLCPMPVPAFSAVKAELGFKFLEVPYAAALEESYLPASLPSETYPNLIAKNTDVKTVATSTILISFNWTPGTERYKKIETFVNAFFSNFDQLRQPPRHPAWRSVNMAASVRGWQRFPAAQQWLDRQAAEAAAKAKAAGSGPDVTQARAQAAKAAPLNAAEQERLFKEFLEWSRTRQKR